MRHLQVNCRARLNNTVSKIYDADFFRVDRRNEVAQSSITVDFWGTCFHGGFPSRFAQKRIPLFSIASIDGLFCYRHCADPSKSDIPNGFCIF